MFTIEIYKQVKLPFSEELSELGWHVASQHTKIEDANEQWQRFLDAGVPEEEIRLAEE